MLQGRVSLFLPELSSDSSLLHSTGMKTSGACILLCFLALSLSPAGESLLQGEDFFSTLALQGFLRRLVCNDLRRKTETCRWVVKGEGPNTKGKVNIGL